MKYLEILGLKAKTGLVSKIKITNSQLKTKTKNFIISL